MHRSDLETLATRELRQLPAPRAPHTLLPRVLAAVQAWSERPWYAREWLTWPVAWQLASVAALMAILAGGVLVGPTVQAQLQDITARSMPAMLTSTLQLPLVFETAVNTSRVLWHTVVQPFLPYVAVLVGLMCLMCAIAAVALNRVVFQRALQS